MHPAQAEAFARFMDALKTQNPSHAMMLERQRDLLLVAWMDGYNTHVEHTLFARDPNRMRKG